MSLGALFRLQKRYRVNQLYLFMQAEKPSNEQLLALGEDAIQKLKAILENPKW